VTESQNISASGVYCSSSHFLSPLSKVALTIILPRIPGQASRQELIKCEGIVVRCDPLAKRGDRRFELACMFSELDLRRRELIEQFVTWRNLQALRAAAGVTRPRVVAGRATATRATGTRASATRATAARPAARRVAARAPRKTATRRRVAR
jgi:hypothetical protein